MTFPLLSYPKYKRSSCPWSRTIPSHWDEVNLWTISKLRNEQNPGDLPLLSVFLHQGVIPHKDSNGQTHAPSLDLSHYQIVRKGDFVLNNQQAWRGSVGVSKYDGIISPAYIVLNLSQKLNPLFADYLFQSEHLVSQYVIASKGVGDIQRQIYWPYLRYIKVPLPPIEEQNAIVRYLDHMDNLIKRYIRAKQKQIKLLNAQKQAVIDQVVTHGLESNPTLEPTGNIWLDFIPTDWQLLPLKRWVSTKITDGPHETPELIDFGVPFMSAESMVNGHLDFNHKRGYISQTTHEYFCKKCHPRKGDIFMCKSGATTGKVVIVETNQEFSVWSPLALIRVNPKKVLPQLLFLVLQSTYVQQQVQTTWSFGTQQNLSMAAMERIQIALPSHEEQLELFAQMTGQLTNLEIIIQKINKEMELIHEYRKRLIADVVVGKLDVYKATARLPVELTMLDQDVEVIFGEGDLADVETESEGGEQ